MKPFGLSAGEVALWLVGGGAVAVAYDPIVGIGVACLGIAGEILDARIEAWVGPARTEAARRRWYRNEYSRWQFVSMIVIPGLLLVLGVSEGDGTLIGLGLAFLSIPAIAVASIRRSLRNDAEELELEVLRKEMRSTPSDKPIEHSQKPEYTSRRREPRSRGQPEHAEPTERERPLPPAMEPYEFWDEAPAQRRIWTAAVAAPATLLFDAYLLFGTDSRSVKGTVFLILSPLLLLFFVVELRRAWNARARSGSAPR